MNLLFISDSFTSINGMSIFSKYFFIYLKNDYDKLIVYDFSKKKFYNYPDFNFINSFEVESLMIDEIYINGYYSKADISLRNGKLFSINNIIRNNNKIRLIIISHGWQKILLRNDIYSFIYFIKHFNKNVEVFFKYYDQILFISTFIDNYRHLDFKLAIKFGKKNSVFNFDQFYLLELQKKNKNLKYSELGLNNFKYILVISNTDYVKNLFSLININYKYLFFKKIHYKNIVLLTTKNNRFFNYFTRFILNIYKIDVCTNQNYKNNLIANCNYLYISSITEYLPIVAIEAFSFNKYVISLYEIPSLMKYNFYKKIKK